VMREIDQDLSEIVTNSISNVMTIGTVKLDLVFAISRLEGRRKTDSAI
jgi:hypothetical protein